MEQKEKIRLNGFRGGQTRSLSLLRVDLLPLGPAVNAFWGLFVRKPHNINLMYHLYCGYLNTVKNFQLQGYDSDLIESSLNVPPVVSGYVFSQEDHRLVCSALNNPLEIIPLDVSLEV